MKKYGSCLLVAGMAVAGCLLFYLSAVFWGNLGWTREDIMFCISEPISENQAVLVMEQHLDRLEKDIQNSEEQKEIPEFCIWGQKEQALVTNENLSRSISAEVILFSGSPELLFEDCRVPQREDRQGCLVDQEAAWKLFGSIQVTGKEITYEENHYIIRKVIPGTNGIAAFPAASSQTNTGKTMPAQAAQGLNALQSEEKALDRVTIKKPENQSVNELQTGWSGWYGVDIQRLDMELLRGLEGFCVLLVPVTVCVFFLIYLCSQFRNQEGWKGKTVMICLILAFILLALFLSGKWINIPDDYIPAKWSDFAFWSQLVKQKQEAVKLLLKIPKSVLDYGWIKYFLTGAGFGLAAEVLTILTVVVQYHRVKMKYKK